MYTIKLFVFIRVKKPASLSNVRSTTIVRETTKTGKQRREIYRQHPPAPERTGTIGSDGGTTKMNSWLERKLTSHGRRGRRENAHLIHSAEDWSRWNGSSTAGRRASILLAAAWFCRANEGHSRQKGRRSRARKRSKTWRSELNPDENSTRSAEAIFQSNANSTR